MLPAEEGCSRGGPSLRSGRSFWNTAALARLGAQAARLGEWMQWGAAAAAAAALQAWNRLPGPPGPHAPLPVSSPLSGSS